MEKHSFRFRARLLTSDLEYRAQIEFSALGVFADREAGLGCEAVRWHRQIVGRRHILKHAASQIVFRAMAMAEIATFPAHLHTAGNGRERWNAAQMRADAYHHQIFWIDRAEFIRGISGLCRSSESGSRSRPRWIADFNAASTAGVRRTTKMGRERQRTTTC